MNEKDYNIDPEFDQWLKENNPRKKMAIPDHYFDQLPDLILEQIQESPNLDTNRRLFIRTKWIKAITGIAAGLAVLVVALLYMNRIVRSDIGSFVEIDFEESYEYLYNHINDYSLYDLSEISAIDEELSNFELEIYAGAPVDFSDELELEDLIDYE